VSPFPAPILRGYASTARIDLDVLHEAVLLRRRGQEHLEELAVLDGHDDMEIRKVVERVAAVVDLEVHVEALGEVRGLHYCVGGMPPSAL